VARRKDPWAAAAAAGDLLCIEGGELAALGRELRALDPDSYDRIVRVAAGLLGKALGAHREQAAATRREAVERRRDERLRELQEREKLLASSDASGARRLQGNELPAAAAKRPLRGVN
jgi:hypothetical protein